MGHPVALQRKCILAQIYDSSKRRKKNYSYTMATRRQSRYISMRPLFLMAEPLFGDLDGVHELRRKLRSCC